MSAPVRRIAVVCHPRLGGSGVVATDLAHGLAQRGHHVHVITSGVLDRPLANCQSLHLHEVESPPYPLFDRPPDMLAMANAIARVCERHAIEVLHVHYAVPHASSAYLARQLLGARAPRLVTTLHGTDVTKVGIEPAYHAVTRMSIAASDALSVPSEFLRIEALRRFQLPTEPPIAVIPNGVDTELFAPATQRDPRQLDRWFASAAGAPTLLHVSNFRPVKRIRDLIEVFAQVHARMPVRLLLIGDGPERPASEARAEELGLTRAVRFLGSRSSVSDLLPHASALMLTSESESFGLAALEALSCGVPVFGYRVGGLPSVVTPDVGRLVTPFDATALADAVADVLADSAVHGRLARAARQRALAHFRLPDAVARYEQLYERVKETDPA
ncbi:MAG: N-acetyl-alpha-D-glucosaminyl L-malate synthase BshA [Polyangiales bacterium]